MSGNEPVTSTALRRAFDSAERLVGHPLERVAALPEASHVLLTVTRAATNVPRRLEELRAAAVHLLALPAHRDIRRLAAQMARLQHSVEEIEQLLEAQNADSR